MEKTVRINKALADAGVCSRRRADELIAAGRVSVNGEPVASPGLQVTPGTDKLEVDGKPVQPIAQAPCYLLLNKPVRVVSTAYDPEGRTTVLDLVPVSYTHLDVYKRQHHLRALEDRHGREKGKRNVRVERQLRLGRRPLLKMGPPSPPSPDFG